MEKFKERLMAEMTEIGDRSEKMTKYANGNRVKNQDKDNVETLKTLAYNLKDYSDILKERVDAILSEAEKQECLAATDRTKAEIELEELNDRLEKLKKFNAGQGAKSLDSRNRALLKKQEDAMERYSGSLSERIAYLAVYEKKLKEENEAAERAAMEKSEN